MGKQIPVCYSCPSIACAYYFSARHAHATIDGCKTCYFCSRLQVPKMVSPQDATNKYLIYTVPLSPLALLDTPANYP